MRTPSLKHAVQVSLLQLVNAALLSLSIACKLTGRLTGRPVDPPLHWLGVRCVKQCWPRQCGGASWPAECDQHLQKHATAYCARRPQGSHCLSMVFLTHSRQCYRPAQVQKTSTPTPQGIHITLHRLWRSLFMELAHLAWHVQSICDQHGGSQLCHHCACP